MGRKKQGVFVEAYEPENCIDSRVRQLYFNALESTAVRKDDVPQVSTKNLVTPKFYLFEKGLGFYQPNLHSPILVISGKTEVMLKKPLSIFKTSLSICSIMTKLLILAWPALLAESPWQNTANLKLLIL